MAIHKKLICPKCGRENSVVYDDCFNFECGDDYRVHSCVGHCENCEVEVFWDEVFNFSHYENIKCEN